MCIYVYMYITTTYPEATLSRRLRVPRLRSRADQLCILCLVLSSLVFQYLSNIIYILHVNVIQLRRQMRPSRLWRPRGTGRGRRPPRPVPMLCHITMIIYMCINYNILLYGIITYYAIICMYNVLYEVMLYYIIYHHIMNPSWRQLCVLVLCVYIYAYVHMCVYVYIYIYTHIYMLGYVSWW